MKDRLKERWREPDAALPVRCLRWAMPLNVHAMGRCLVVGILAVALGTPARAADYVWSGGNFVPGVTAPRSLWPPDSLAINAGTAKAFVDVEFDNWSTVTWNADNIGFASASDVVNEGLWDARSDHGLIYASGDRSHFVNYYGSFRKSGGGGTTTIGAINFVNIGGSIEAQTGTIDFSGGFAAFNDDSSFIGAGVNRVSANATFSGDIRSTNLVLAGGTFSSVNGPARLYGTTAWTGGSFVGHWEVPSGQTLTGQGGLDKTFNATDFVNNGRINWQGANSLRFNASSVVNNGLLDLQGDASLVHVGGAVTEFENYGTLRKSAGTLSSIGSNIRFFNSGTIEAQTGTIDFSGGNAIFSADTRFVGAGVNKVSSNAEFHGGLYSSNLVLVGGSFSSTVGTAIEGAVAWTGGSFTGNWQLMPGQTLETKTGGTKTFSAVTFENQGTLAWRTADDWRFANGSSLVSSGLVDLQADADLVHVGGAISQFVNHGTLRKSAGAVSRIVGIEFSNPGIVDVRHGGQLVLPNDFTNAGTITGGGVVQTNVLTNGGHVAPGDGVGGSRVVGNFVQAASGTLDIELGHEVYDLLSVFGSASLDGTLTLSCVGDCRYAVGEQLDILWARDGRRGEFQSPPTLYGFGSGAFEVSYGYDHVRLRVSEAVTPVPEPATWALGLAGLALLAAAVRQRRVVTRTEPFTAHCISAHRRD